jgi:hypothetical protein
MKNINLKLLLVVLVMIGSSGVNSVAYADEHNKIIVGDTFFETINRMLELYNKEQKGYKTGKTKESVLRQCAAELEEIGFTLSMTIKDDTGLDVLFCIREEIQ